jgi:glutamate dehydrogenase/leucine dehydrogenase
MATVVSFQTILKYIRPPDVALAWGVKGAGHLGSRIIRLIAGRARHVYVAERLSDRQSEIAELDNISIVESDVLANVSADAIIFAADSGSLNMHVANVIAANECVGVFGGPEAGLDRHVNAIQKLALAGKWFVPSVLCGSLGLVSNLEEVLNHPLDIEAQAHRLEFAVSAMAEQAYVRHIPFHEICSMVLRGIESI